MAIETQSNSVGSFQSQGRVFRIGLYVMDFQFNLFALPVFKAAPLAGESVADETITDKGFIFRLGALDDPLRGCATFPHSRPFTFMAALWAELRQCLFAPRRAFHWASTVGAESRECFTLPVPVVGTGTCRSAGAILRDFLLCFGRGGWVTRWIVSECLTTGYRTELPPLFPSSIKLYGTL